MLTNTLRADNYADWNPRWFDKSDVSSDFGFYTAPRKVVHIDDIAIAAVTQLYRECLPAGGAILDLMSSWRSHLPPEIDYGRVTGLGMNGEEMRDNAQLSDFVVHSLNDDSKLPFADQEFDAACCCVSVQYLQKPVEVFREVARILKPGGVFMTTFSNRCFPSKAINLWKALDDEDHMNVVAVYFQAAGQWRDVVLQDRSAPCAQQHQCDPLYAVWAYADKR